MVADLCMWGTDGRNDLALVPPVDSEIVFVHRDHRMTGIKFTHADQTQVGQVRLTILVAPGEVTELVKVADTIECNPKHFILHQRENVRA